MKGKREEKPITVLAIPFVNGAESRLFFPLWKGFHIVANVYVISFLQCCLPVSHILLIPYCCFAASVLCDTDGAGSV